MLKNCLLLPIILVSTCEKWVVVPYLSSPDHAQSYKEFTPLAIPLMASLQEISRHVQFSMHSAMDGPSQSHPDRNTPVQKSRQLKGNTACALPWLQHGFCQCAPFPIAAVGHVLFCSELQFQPAGKQLSRTKKRCPTELRYHQLAPGVAKAPAQLAVGKRGISASYSWIFPDAKGRAWPKLGIVSQAIKNLLACLCWCSKVAEPCSGAVLLTSTSPVSWVFMVPLKTLI